MQGIRNLLTQLREARRQIVTSNLPASLKLAYFRHELTRNCTNNLRESAAEQKVEAVLQVTHTILSGTGTQGMYNFASEALSQGLIDRRVLQQVGVSAAHLYPTIDISKESASQSIAACIARMYCTFIKEAVESEIKAKIAVGSITPGTTAKEITKD